MSILESLRAYNAVKLLCLIRQKDRDLWAKIQQFRKKEMQ